MVARDARRRRKWLYSMPFLLLPFKPAWFPIFVVPIGLFLLASGRETALFKKQLLAFLVLIGTAQVLVIAFDGSQLPERTLYEKMTGLSVAEGGSAKNDNNLVSYRLLAGLRGWNRQDGANTHAVWLGDGFWRVARDNAETGRDNTHIYVVDRTSIAKGQTYTRSFYFRHDGSHIGFTIDFRTARGGNRVPANLIDVANGIYRAYATYTVQDGDKHFVRGFEVNGFDGDWTYLDIGFHQLEMGSAPTTYSPSKRDKPRNPWHDLLQWVSLPLLVATTLHGSRYLLRRSSARVVAVLLTIGLFGHATIAWIDFAGISWAAELPLLGTVTTGDTYLDFRAQGLTAHPNFLGHLSVLGGALVWLIGPRAVGLLALLLSFLLVYLTGSRGAFIAWLPLMVAWIATLPRRHLYILLSVAALGSLMPFVATTPYDLGRLAETLSLGERNIQARLQTWQVSAEAFVHRPLFGIGTNQLGAFLDLNRPEETVIGQGRHGHNVLVHILAENGLLGLTGLLILFCGAVKALYRLAPWRALFFLTLVLILNSTDYTLFSAEVLYPLLVGLAWSLRDSE